jgi:hypothetical protein
LFKNTDIALKVLNCCFLEYEEPIKKILDIEESQDSAVDLTESQINEIDEFQLILSPSYSLQIKAPNGLKAYKEDNLKDVKSEERGLISETYVLTQIDDEPKSENLVDKDAINITTILPETKNDPDVITCSHDAFESNQVEDVEEIQWEGIKEISKENNYLTISEFINGYQVNENENLNNRFKMFSNDDIAMVQKIYASTDYNSIVTKKLGMPILVKDLQRCQIGYWYNDVVIFSLFNLL